MTEKEHILTCVVEEAGEISEAALDLAKACQRLAQRVSKALRFGLTEIQPGQEMTNAQRIEAELADLVGVVRLLEERGVISWPPDPAAVEAKVAKVSHFLNYAREQGTVTE